MKRLKIFIASLSLLLVPVVAVPALVYAAPTDAKTNKTNDSSSSDSSAPADAVQTACGALDSKDCSGGGTGLNKIITAIVNILSLIVGIVAVIMIIVGGLRYVASAGDSNAVSGAKNTIIFAIVGLVIVALAQFLVQFVLNRVAK